MDHLVKNALTNDGCRNLLFEIKWIITYSYLTSVLSILGNIDVDMN
jgi:hypothetical protein